MCLGKQHTYEVQRIIKFKKLSGTFPFRNHFREMVSEREATLRAGLN